MAKEKKEKQARHDIIVDMNDFLMDYAATKLGRQPDLAQKIVAAGQPDLTGLDDLFKDNGVGRRTKYLELAEGFLRDEADIDADLAKDVSGESQELAKEAMSYLSSHPQDFDRWEEA
ncbi:hypothetical protein [Levilactobacillus spicheri]|uniref:Uncharacterized protein n=2 Tax=Levilactobacillus spicheri TaxID=216463 RepID=A0A0F3RVR8_9LACO|nr:hypothetical protein [Levilactobacillus spicheri]KJW13699.1 hypothetical protein VC81_01595 [Levilactobacillus spicheri]KRL46876.1 hypothetical protein FD37_GL000353 [Levilactobacillus spicheri DSM 15429]GEO67445.1 hypothetical protein LSP04_18640 [Levilactobacillus spicheri]